MNIYPCPPSFDDRADSVQVPLERGQQQAWPSASRARECLHTEVSKGEGRRIATVSHRLGSLESAHAYGERLRREDIRGEEEFTYNGRAEDWLVLVMGSSEVASNWRG